MSESSQYKNEVTLMHVRKPRDLAITATPSNFKLQNSHSSVFQVHHEDHYASRVPILNTTSSILNSIPVSTVKDEGSFIEENIEGDAFKANSTTVTDVQLFNHSSSDSLGTATKTSIIATVVKAIILITIIIAAIFSNILVVISVARYRKLRHINNYFLVSLAIADIFVACFAMFFSASTEILGKWNFGYRICDLYNSLDVHFSTVSTLHLCCIAIDRYYAIVRPLKYSTNMTVHVAAAMIGIAWTAPTLISFLPIFLGWYTTEDHLKWRKEHPDICLLKPNLPYALLSSVLTFWLPVSVMLIMYHRVYKEAQRQKEAIRRSSVPSQQHLIVDTESVKSRFQVLQANGFKGLRNGGGNTKKRNSSDGSSTSGLTNTGCLNAISNNTKNVNFLPTARHKLQSSISIGQLHSSSTANSKLDEQAQKDKKLIRPNIMDEHDSELETITVPMLDSSPGGKKSFRIENSENGCDMVDNVDNAQLENTDIKTGNGSDCINGSSDIPIGISKPIPTPGVKITLPSPCEPSATQSCYLNESSSHVVNPDNKSQIQTQTNPSLSNSTISSSPEPKSVLKRQPPPLPPRGVVTYKSVENYAASSSSGTQTNVKTLPANNNLNVGSSPIPRLSAESAVMAGSITPRRLSAAASSLSEGLRERHRIHTSWRKEHKAFVTLGIVMGAFLICWLPFFTWYLTVTACGDYCFNNCPETLVAILFWIGYFNSTLNPLIYVMTNRDFKDAFKDILQKTFCWCCPSRNVDEMGFPVSSGGGGMGGTRSGGLGDSMSAPNPDRLNVDYV